ncbi:MAG: chromate efflux transporter [Limnobacter sp.]|nr:chromate efflux transporter [Limnobacter sp.]
MGYELVLHESKVGQVSALEVFVAFLRLGCTSFGGPVAHVGYFRTELVQRRQWLNESHFAQLLALCQFLPGPASSQLGAGIGLYLAGWWGALAAFVAFTLPSVLLLMLFAAGLEHLSPDLAQAVVHGLKLVAAIVVADAVYSMSKNLCPDFKTRLVALVSLVGALLLAGSLFQMLIILFAAVAGVFVFSLPESVSGNQPMRWRFGKRTAAVLLVVFLVLFLGLPFFSGLEPALGSVADLFYRAGALVFGGGHVVLPLLEPELVKDGWLTADQFLAGYGAAQAIPGPLFSVSAYWASILPATNPAPVMALVALLAIFLPGFLLLAAVLPWWEHWSRVAWARTALLAVNASVVGLLAAAFVDPVLTSALVRLEDGLLLVVGLALLKAFRLPVLVVVALCVASSVAFTFWIPL